MGAWAEAGGMGFPPLPSPASFCSSFCTQFSLWVYEAKKAVSFELQLSDNIPILRPCKGEGSQALSLPAATHKSVTISRSCLCCLGNLKRSKRAGRILGDCAWKIAQDTSEVECICREKVENLSLLCKRHCKIISDLHPCSTHALACRHQLDVEVPS